MRTPGTFTLTAILLLLSRTGLAEEVKDIVLRAFRGAESRAEGFLDWIKDQIVERTDTLIEDAVRKPITPIWEEMKRDARLPFEVGEDEPMPDDPDGGASADGDVSSLPLVVDFAAGTLDITVNGTAAPEILNVVRAGDSPGSFVNSDGS